MNIFDKIMLTVYTLFIMFISIVVILFSTQIISLDFFSTSLSMLYGRWETSIVGLVLLLISLRLFFLNIKTERNPETSIHNGELGNVSITLKAIESLVKKVIGETEDIKDAKIKIHKQNDCISIILKIMINHDVIIPDMTKELQLNIKDYIENTAGISVTDVKVSIENILTEAKQKTVK